MARAHVMIAASIGYWRLEHAPFRYQALYFWRIHGPLMLRLHGYVPHGRIWSGAALPPGVFQQWREWCMHPNHFGPALATDLREAQFAAVRGPILAYGFDDDPIATPAAVTALLSSFYSQASVELRWASARAAGVGRIGHHGFFSERHRAGLWRAVLDWIDERCAGARVAPLA
jgi:predicted alpha/beta hydrolase